MHPDKPLKFRYDCVIVDSANNRREITVYGLSFADAESECKRVADIQEDEQLVRILLDWESGPTH